MSGSSQPRHLSICCSLCLECAHPNFFPCQTSSILRSPGERTSLGGLPNPAQAGLIHSSWSSLGTCPRERYYVYPLPDWAGVFITRGQDPELSGLAQGMLGCGLGENTVSPPLYLHPGGEGTQPPPPTLAQCGVTESSPAMKFHPNSHRIPPK